MVGLGESNLFGGVFFVRSDDKSITTISDLKGRVVAASSILLMGAGQTQWQEMRQYGLDLLVDPAQVTYHTFFQEPIVQPCLLDARCSFLLVWLTIQVIFVGYDQSKIVEEVLSGRADVGWFCPSRLSATFLTLIVALDTFLEYPILP